MITDPDGVATARCSRSVPRFAGGGAAIMGVMVSPLRGAEGNVEFLCTPLGRRRPAAAAPGRRCVDRVGRGGRRPTSPTRARLMADARPGRAPRPRRGAERLGPPRRRWLDERGHGVRLPADDAELLGLRRPGLQPTTRSPPGSTSRSPSVATARCCAPCDLVADARRAGARHQRRPTRLPDRDRSGRAGSERSSGSSPATYAIDERMLLAVDRRRAVRRARRASARSWCSTRPCSRRARWATPSGCAVSIDGRVLHQLRGRRAHRGHADRFDRVRASRPAGPIVAPEPPGPPAHARVAAHAVRPHARARAVDRASASRSAAVVRRRCRSTGGTW